MSDVPGAQVSAAWAEWRRRVDLDAYVARFHGSGAHGEADFVSTLEPRPGSVLDAGCGTGRFATELARRGHDVVGVDLDDDLLVHARRIAPDLTWICDDLARLDLGRRFDVVALPGNVLLFCRVADRSAIVSRCAVHVAPGGALVAGFSLRGVGEPLDLDEYDWHCAAAGLTLEARWSTWDRAPYVGGDYAVSLHRPS
jgi:SAM-dependent methyltransferase